ncbi:D-alanyl-D-alanine carboxypeptidase [Salinibacterium hongtaonis]|uniref:D-alanyl-D-alanine carboxypeptidase n=1 Tax=Homoserinimonas hongtaonis TaxID=2079791 RepID=UPI000D392095|nr:D-alanyl-D-alanine carboxypeptidase [Salinibacterium hongtaonis]AWB88543.1 hypothetical protein C2138_02350 [Salinibacterium hongtaonis]
MIEPGQPPTRRQAREALSQHARGRAASESRPAQGSAGTRAGAGAGAAKVARAASAVARSSARGVSAAATSVVAAVRSWARSPRQLLMAGAAIVVVVLATAVVMAGVGSGRASMAALAAVEPEAAARFAPELAAGPVRLRTCTVDTSEPALAELAASVVSVSTGEQLLARGDGAPISTLELSKVATAIVALQVLGPDTRIPTRVYEGSIAGSVVLVGGGDATLSALPSGVESVYAGAPRMNDLAAQTTAALAKLYPPAPVQEDDEDDDGRRGPGGRPGPRPSPPPAPAAPEQPAFSITQVMVDSTLWSGEPWDAGWASAERTVGTQANITPLMVDGDRQDPAVVTSPRGEDPVASAAAAFISALGLGSGTAISTGAVLPDSPLLAEVWSQPVSVLVTQMLQLGDNTLADMLARLASTSVGSDGTAASLEQVYRSVLGSLEVDTAALVMSDGSGLDLATVAPPEVLARLLAATVSNPALVSITAALPVAGVSGTMAPRFAGELAHLHSTFSGVGTSTATAATLGGILTASDGTVLTLSLQATGAVSPETNLAFEHLVEKIYECGDNLSGAVRAAE